MLNTKLLQLYTYEILMRKFSHQPLPETGRENDNMLYSIPINRNKY
jgi:hypothetical protein